MKALMKYLLMPMLVFSLGKSALASEREFLNELARTYAPEMREHEREKYPLANAQWIWERAGIMYKGKTLIEPGKIPESNLKNLKVLVNGKLEPVMRENHSQGLIKGLALIIPQRFYRSTDNGTPAEPVCYAHARRSQNGNSIDISYIWFSPYNGTPRSGIFGVTPILEKLGVGHHEGDIEHITVRLDHRGSDIRGVHYARHGHTEGRWYTSQGRMSDSDGYKINRTGQITTWSALETHGNSNGAGMHRRNPPAGIFGDLVELIGVLVEETSDNGVHYDCRQHLQILPTEIPVTTPGYEWMNFRGDWGRPKPPKAARGGSGPAGVLDKGWWVEEPGGPQ